MDLENLSGEWTIDPGHTRIGFSSRHAMVTRVRGAFNEVAGHASIDATDLSRSTVEVTVQMDSIDTRNADRDAHLRSSDFFDIPNHPAMTFVSTIIDEVEEDSFVVTGDLTIRGMTRSVTIPLSLIGVDTDPFGNVRAGLEGSRRIDRKNWDITWNAALDSGGLLVSDKITLEFELSLIKEAAPAAEEEETAAEATAVTEATAAEAPAPEAPAEDTTADSADVSSAEAQASPAEAAPSEAAPSEAAPSEAADVQPADEEAAPSTDSAAADSAPEASASSPEASAAPEAPATDEVSADDAPALDETDTATSADGESSPATSGDAPKLYDSPTSDAGSSAAEAQSPTRPSNPPKSFASAFKLNRR